jgi:RNAse (barnase) inhibitor barstar
MALGVHPCALQVLSTSKSISSAEASNDLTIVWDLARSVTSDVTLVWNVVKEINRDVTLIWDLQRDVTEDLTIIWDVVTDIKVDLTLIWNITDKKAFVVNKNRYCSDGTSRTKPFCG